MQPAPSEQRPSGTRLMDIVYYPAKDRVLQRFTLFIRHLFCRQLPLIEIRIVLFYKFPLFRRSTAIQNFSCHTGNMRGYALLFHNRFFLIKSQKQKEVPNSNREKKKNKRSQMRLKGHYRCQKLVLARLAGHLTETGNSQGRKIFSKFNLNYIPAFDGKGPND